MELTAKKMEQLIKNMVRDLAAASGRATRSTLEESAARTLGAKDYHGLRAILKRDFAERKAKPAKPAANRLVVIPGDEPCNDLYALTPSALSTEEVDLLVVTACQELTDQRGDDEWQWQDLAAALRSRGIEVVVPERSKEPWDRAYIPRRDYLDFTAEEVRQAFGHECPRYDREDWGHMIAAGGSRGYFEYAADSLACLAGELAGNGYAVDYDRQEDGYSFITPSGNPSFPYESAADAWLAAERHRDGDIAEDDPDSGADYSGLSDHALQSMHRDALAVLEASGGRGVEEAETVDGTRRELLRRRLPKLARAASGK